MSVTAAVIKITASLAKDKNGRKVLGTIISVAAAAILIIIGAFFTIASSLSNGSHSVFARIFGGDRDIPFDAPSGMIQMDTDAINRIMDSLDRVAAALEPVNERCGDDRVDVNWPKAVFYTVYFEQPVPPEHPVAEDYSYSAFAECFVVTTTDETTGEEVSAPQTDDAALLASLREVAGELPDDTLAVARENYNRIAALQAVE